VRIVYQGPHRGVFVAAGVECVRGVAVDVDESLASRLVARPDFEQEPEAVPSTDDHEEDQQ